VPSSKRLSHDSGNLVHRRDFLGASVLTAMGTLMNASCTKEPDTAPVIETAAGKIRGVTEGGVTFFKNVPYAAPPTGDGRFMPPRKLVSWNGVRDARVLGPQAPQNDSKPILPRFMEGLMDTTATNSEDCLQLHVWTPRVGQNQKRPVMVWLHGGAFGSGSPNWPLYDGSNLASKQGVVVVGVKHRVNAFGFLYLAELGGEKYADSGMAGMLDIVAALQWVRDNIANFGGDPDNVTIFGESGGGAKVTTVMGMPAAKGLFHKAIVQSTVSLKGASKADATKLAIELMAKLGLKPSQVDELQKVPMEKLLEAMTLQGQYQFAPVVDGRSLPSGPFDPVAPEVSAEVPLLIGKNATEITGLIPGISTDPIDDATLRKRVKEDTKAGDADVNRLIAAYKKARPKASNLDIYWAIASDDAMGADVAAAIERKIAQGKAPVYVYELTWIMPAEGGKLGSPHLLDLPLVFQNVSIARGMLGPAPAPDVLSGRMAGAWAAFARTGNPDHMDIPHWPAYDAATRSTMIFDNECKVVNDPEGGERVAMAAFRGKN
jgi:para-nitrobenzyl esterase